jgi:anti-sigma-K factor RskA
MTARDHERFADDAGAYLLGALDPGEHRAFEAHLEDCDACREEVVRLEVARDALPRAVDQVAPPDRLKANLMSTVRAEAADAPAAAPSSARAPERRSRWRELVLARPRFAAAAAAVLLAVGVAAGALVGALGGGDGGGDSKTVAAQVDAVRMPAAKASLVVPDDAEDEGGAILRVEGMQQPQSGHVYEVWIKRGDEVTPSSLFTVEHDGSGAAAIPDELRDADAVLVTREPAGGSRRPSEAPVLTVPLRS